MVEDLTAEVETLQRTLEYQRSSASKDARSLDEKMRLLRIKFSNAFNIDFEEWDGRAASTYSRDRLKEIIRFVEGNGFMVLTKESCVEIVNGCVEVSKNLQPTTLLATTN